MSPPAIVVTRLLLAIRSTRTNHACAAAMLDTNPYHDCYEHPLYFLCQMFIRGWMVRETYDCKFVEMAEC